MKELEKKEIYMIYVSLIIVFGVIYYYFNYSYLYSEQLRLESKKEKLNKEVRKRLLNFTKLQKKYTLLMKKNKELKEDFSYLATLIDSSQILVIDRDKFYKIIERMLKISTYNGIYPSTFKLSSKDEGFIKEYIIAVDGKFENEKFFNFVNFIREFEQLKSLNGIKQLQMSEANEKKEKKSIKKKNNKILFGLIQLPNNQNIPKQESVVKKDFVDFNLTFSVWGIK